MKLKTSIILCSVLAATSAPAMANPVWDLYVGATIGAGGQTMFNDGHDKTETAQSFGGMFGIDLPVSRVEAEYNYLFGRVTGPYICNDQNKQKTSGFSEKGGNVPEFVYFCSHKTNQDVYLSYCVGQQLSHAG